MLRSLIAGAIALALLTHAGPADARNTPCSGKKGGVKACQGEKYLCNDGTLSASKTKCSR